MIWILNRATLHKLHRGIKPGYRGSIFKGEVKLERTIITGCETPWNIVTFNVAQGGIPFYPLQTLVKRVTVSCTNGSNILLIRTMNGEYKSFTRALMRLLRSCVWIYALVRRERISITATGLRVFTKFVRVSFITVQRVKVEQLTSSLFKERIHRIRKTKEIFFVCIYNWMRELCNRIIVDFLI